MLKTIAYGEIGAVIGWSYNFGLMIGVVQLINIWIYYAAYATINPFVVLVAAFCGGMELIDLFMNVNDGGDFQEAVFDT